MDIVEPIHYNSIEYKKGKASNEDELQLMAPGYVSGRNVFNKNNGGCYILW